MHPFAIPAPSQDVPRGVYFDVKREIWLLRSTILYHDVFGYYPFDSIEARADFCEKWVQMTMGEHCTESFNLRKKYDERSRKRFQDLSPHDQEAFEMGIEIWGGREEEEPHNSGKEKEGVNQDSMFSEEDYSSGEEESEEEIEDDEAFMFADEEDEREGQHEGERLVEYEEGEGQHEGERLKELFDRIPLLKESFKFGANITDDMKIPVISRVVVKDCLAALGSEKLEKWNNNLKEMMVEELKIFLKMVNMIREQTVIMLAQIKPKPKPE